MNFDLDAILAVLGPIMVVAIGAALIKKAISLAITLIAILVIAFMLLQTVGASPLP